MRRRIAISLSATLALTACGGGAPPIPQSVIIASASTQPVVVTITAVEPSVLDTIIVPTVVPVVIPNAVVLTAMDAPAAKADATTAAATSAPAVRPLDIAACEQLWGEVAQRLGVNVERSDAPFADERIGSGTSCRLVAMGSGAQFKPFVDVAADLRSLLTQRDWTEDPTFAADAPTGTFTAYRRGPSVALVSVGWQPEHGVNCDGPIAECEVPAAQQRFTVSLDLVDPAP